MTMGEKLALQLSKSSDGPRGDLAVASGQVGFNKPYRAPIYLTYGECIRGLYKQGLLGFYKGNGCRVLHVYLYESFRNHALY